MARLDKIKTELMREAEKKCRKLKMGAVDFSPAMAAAGDLVRLRGLVKRRGLGHRIASRTIQRLAKKLKVKKPLSCTLEQATVLHKEAMEAYYILKPNAPVLRREFLLAKLDDETQSEENRKAVHQLLNNEKARETSRKMKRIKNLPHLGAISRIEIPPETPGGRPTFLDTQAAVEKAIMETIDLRYRLTHSTPFLQEPLLATVGLTGTSLAAQQILDGTFICLAGVDETTQLLIKLLKRPADGVLCIETTITCKDFQQYWKRARQRTSSSMSGLHFGHWKAAAGSDELSETHSLFMEIAISTGYAPPPHGGCTP
jgi:hypothetical protein